MIIAKSDDVECDYATAMESSQGCVGVVDWWWRCGMDVDSVKVGKSARRDVILCFVKYCRRQFWD
jgi:hypothetical protein